jgi:hypothetical protein
LHKAGATDKKLGYALRFPRLMGYRPEKTPYEATTVTEIERLYDLQFSQNLNKKQRQKVSKLNSGKGNGRANGNN